MRLDLPPEIIESMKKLLNSNSSLTEPEFEPIRDILDDFLSSGYKDHEIQAEFRLSALEMTTLDSKMEEMEPGWKLKERNARHRFTGRLRAEALEDAPIAQRLSLLGMLDSDFSPKSNIDISVNKPLVILPTTVRDIIEAERISPKIEGPKGEDGERHQAGI